MTKKEGHDENAWHFLAAQTGDHIHSIPGGHCVKTWGERDG
jgi:hypothetical protein